MAPSPCPCPYPLRRSANVLLSQEWRAALSDFGVAQVLAHSARTAAGGSSLYAGGLETVGQAG